VIDHPSLTDLKFPQHLIRRSHKASECPNHHLAMTTSQNPRLIARQQANANFHASRFSPPSHSSRPKENYPIKTSVYCRILSAVASARILCNENNTKPDQKETLMKTPETPPASIVVTTEPHDTRHIQETCELCVGYQVHHQGPTEPSVYEAASPRYYAWCEC